MLSFFSFYSLSLNYKCVLPDHTYFARTGQRTENKLIVVSFVSVVKTPTDLFFSAMSTCTFAQVQYNILQV